MGFADVWNQTLVYFGIAEEEDWDEDGYLTDEELSARTRAPERAPARAAAPRRDEYDDWTDPEPDGQRTSILRPRSEPRRVRNAVSRCRGPGRRRECTSSSRAASTTRSRSPTASRRASR